MPHTYRHSVKAVKGKEKNEKARRWKGEGGGERQKEGKVAAGYLGLRSFTGFIP